MSIDSPNDFLSSHASTTVIVFCSKTHGPSGRRVFSAALPLDASSSSSPSSLFLDILINPSHSLSPHPALRLSLHAHCLAASGFSTSPLRLIVLLFPTKSPRRPFLPRPSSTLPPAAVLASAGLSQDSASLGRQHRPSGRRVRRHARVPRRPLDTVDTFGHISDSCFTYTDTQIPNTIHITVIGLDIIYDGRYISYILVKTNIKL